MPYIRFVINMLLYHIYDILILIIYVSMYCNAISILLSNYFRLYNISSFILYSSV